MRRAEVDYILGTMLDSSSGVSDLNITADKPLQVETSGELVPVDIDPPVDKLTPFQTETLALNLINSSRRLTNDLLRRASRDQSYSLGQKARFRVNIFTQRGHNTIILRKLSTEISSLAQLNLPLCLERWPRRRQGSSWLPGRREAANRRR
jgi:twitching motility protein PilT